MYLPLPPPLYSRRRPPRQGFALVIAISMLAFIVLIMLSLSMLTRIETQTAKSSQHMLQARQNALLGLSIAIGRLQELAGPDQRITATADIVENRGDAKRNWTGVWNAAEADATYGDLLGWLVSGGVAANEEAATGAPVATNGQTLVRLVGENTVDAGDSANLVDVLTETIQRQGDAQAGTIDQFAYWIGDEGVKAKATLVDPWATQTGVKKRYSFVNMQRSGVEMLEAAGTDMIGDAYPVNHATLPSIHSLKQLPMLPASAAPARLKQAIINRYHDITVQSFSVLADVTKGGLKKDLTHWLNNGAMAGAIEQDSAPIITTATGVDIPQWGLLRSYANTVADGTATPSVQSQNNSGLAPVITLFRMGVNISATAGDRLNIHLFPELVLWNPYSIPLPNVDPETGSPIIYQVGWRVSNARRILFYPGNAPSKEIGRLELSSNFFVFDIELTEPIAPGRSLVFRVKDDAGNNPVYNAGGGTVLINKANDGTAAVVYGSAVLSEADVADGITWQVNSTSGDTMLLVLREKTTSAPQATGDTAGEYQAVKGVGFDNFSGSGYTNSRSDLEGVILDPQFAFTVASRMASTLSGGSSRWIANQNYTARFSPRASLDGSFHSIWFGNISSLAGPVTALSFAEGGLRANAGEAVTGTTASDVVLREIAPQDTVFTSLAQFQHANLSLLSHYPFYAIGNSLASPYIPLGGTEADVTGASPVTKLHDISWLLNRELWDRYFLSTAAATLTNAEIVAPAFSLPNARLVPITGTTAVDLTGAKGFDTAAAHLLLDGGFNVNSTSPQAWRALLAGHRDLEVLGEARHPLSRFILPAGTPNSALEGHRILTDVQIAALADAIVEEVQGRGPFLSLADFVNRRTVARGRNTSDAQRLKGTLQAAIDNADTKDTEPVLNTDSGFQSSEAGTKPSGAHQPQFQGGTTKQKPVSSRLAFAPGYLTQADLLTAIGPALTARSDTFVIRAYGDTRNPTNGEIQSTAWCEAVVQRLPEYVDKALSPWDTPAAGSDAERFGRRFEIISFRWLSPSDI